MLVTPVDSENNLFLVEKIIPQDLIDKIINTNWLDLPYSQQQGHDFLKRRRIDDAAIPWIEQWTRCCQQLWPDLSAELNIKIHDYPDANGTAWWVDEPGFVCKMHTDGEMLGAMQLFWRGPATAFYWYNDPATLRYQVPSNPNAGYIMLNRTDNIGYRKLLWHAMLTPSDSYRVTSYTWIVPQ